MSAALIVALLLGQTVTDRNYDELRAQIVPSAEERRWLEIPWHVTLGAAVAEARRLDRPVLLYAMNGHPLASC